MKCAGGREVLPGQGCVQAGAGAVRAAGVAVHNAHHPGHRG